MRNILSLSALLAALAVSVPAVAQTPASPPAAPPTQPSLRHSHPMIPAAPPTGTAPVTGGFVGNKKSHVYHVPGDKGALPAAQNRVYFHTEAEAVAAGYHKAGSASKTTHPKTLKPAVKPAP